MDSIGTDIEENTICQIRFEIKAHFDHLNKLLVHEQLIKKQIDILLHQRNTYRALRLSYQRPRIQSTSSPASVTSIASYAFSRLVELEESLRGVHALFYRSVLRDTMTLEARLRALLDCKG